MAQINILDAYGKPIVRPNSALDSIYGTNRINATQAFQNGMGGIGNTAKNAIRTGKAGLWEYTPYVGDMYDIARGGYQALHGHPILGTAQMLMGGAGLIANTIAPGSGTLAKSAIKGVVKGGGKKVVRTFGKKGVETIGKYGQSKARAIGVPLAFEGGYYASDINKGGNQTTNLTVDQLDKRAGAQTGEGAQTTQPTANIQPQDTGIFIDENGYNTSLPGLPVMGSDNNYIDGGQYQDYYNSGNNLGYDMSNFGYNYTPSPATINLANQLTSSLNKQNADLVRNDIANKNLGLELMNEPIDYNKYMSPADLQYLDKLNMYQNALANTQGQYQGWVADPLRRAHVAKFLGMKPGDIWNRGEALTPQEQIIQQYKFATDAYNAQKAMEDNARFLKETGDIAKVTGRYIPSSFLKSDANKNVALNQIYGPAYNENQDLREFNQKAIIDIYKALMAGDTKTANAIINGEYRLSNTKLKGDYDLGREQYRQEGKNKDRTLRAAIANLGAKIKLGIANGTIAFDKADAEMGKIVQATGDYETMMQYLDYINNKYRLGADFSSLTE